LLITLIVKCNVFLNPILSVSRKKIRIELEDENGEKYNLTLQGALSKEKIVNLIEFVQLFEKNSTTTSSEHREGDRNLASKLWNLITENFRYHTFTSSDLARIYKDVYYDSIQLSIASIYLSRFYLKKQLTRIKNGKQWVYAVVKDNQNNAAEYLEKSNHPKLLSVPTVYDLHL
jgi:hypothetical protein